MFPVIRGRRSPPRLGDGRDSNIPSGLLKGSLVSESDIDVDLGNLGTRQTILSGDFADGYEDNPDWTFPPKLIFNNATMNDLGHGILNGSPSVSIEWLTTAGVGDRWGARMRLPLLPGFPNGYREGWFTHDFRFKSPFGNTRGMKVPGMRTGFTPSGGGGISPAGAFPNGQLSYRTMLSNDGDDNNSTGPRRAHQYYYHFNAIRQVDRWDGGAMVIELETVSRIEIHFKWNTAFNVSDGIIETRYDPGSSTVHKPPTTLRARKTNLRMFATAGLEHADSGAVNVRFLTWECFFGGDHPTSWMPFVDSTVEYGAWKFEIPL